MILESFLAGVRRDVLPNGLTLITRETKGCGVVAINTWVKAGYFHEPDEVAGMAHLFEHMFFKGSTRFPGPEEIAQHVSTLGGSTNAGTIYDSTNYYFVMPREGFVRGIEIQADAVMHPLFDPEELKREAEVVIEESNRKFDNPPALATERMFAVAFNEHRMKRWRIGSNEVLRNIRRDDLVAFFETLYRPENIIVTVTGDAGHAEILEVVGRTLGELPRGVMKKERGPREPEQQGFRFAESTGDIQQAWSVWGWHTPGEHDASEESLDVLASILGSGRSSRLYRGVVGPSSASSTSASNSVFEDVGIFTVRASGENANVEEIERRVFREIERMKQYGPTDYELALVQNRIEASFVFELEEVLGQAQTLSYCEARGSYLDAGAHLQRLRKVDRADVQDAARRFLTTENLTLYRYRPAGSPAGETGAILSTIESASKDLLENPADIDIPVPGPGVSRARRDRKTPDRYVLSSGATLFVQESRETPTVSVSIDFRGGRIHEHSRNAGITQLMARSMRRGTGRRTAEEIDRDLEFLGSQLSVRVDEDFLGFGFDVLATHFGSALDVAADVILDPTFPADGIEQERHLQLASIRRSIDSSSDRPFQLYQELFYGSHPYGLPDAGYASSVESLGRDDLMAWYSETIVADAAVIVVVGDVDAEEVRGRMESLLGRMPSSATLKAPVPRFIPPISSREIVEWRDRKQSVVIVGYPSVPPTHPDWISLKVLQDVTSGLAGTLFAELRGRRSLAYTVFAGDASRQTAASFVAYIATEAAKEQEAREALMHELSRLSEDGFGEADVARARAHMAGSTKIRLQTNSAVAGDLAHHYLYGLGLDFTERMLERIRTVEVEELRAIAKKYVGRDNVTVAILRGKT